MYSGHLCEKGGVRISESENEENMCSHIREVVYRLMELGPIDVFCLERWPHFRVWYIRISIKLHFKMCPYYSGPSFQREVVHVQHMVVETVQNRTMTTNCNRKFR